MRVSWNDFVDAFRVGASTGTNDQLDALLSDDFNWVTSDMDRQATLDWTANTSYRINGDAETFYENDEVIAGTHPVIDDEGRQNMVMGVARLRDGKIYRYDHLRRVTESA